MLGELLTWFVTSLDPNNITDCVACFVIFDEWCSALLLRFAFLVIVLLIGGHMPRKCFAMSEWITLMTLQSKYKEYGLPTSQ